MDLGLKGKMALVTGESKGLGKAIAEEPQFDLPVTCNVALEVGDVSSEIVAD